MRNYRFPIRKGEIFRSGKEIKGLRGGVHGYIARISPQIDTAWAEKDHFRTETQGHVKVLYRSELTEE